MADAPVLKYVATFASDNLAKSSRRDYTHRTNTLATLTNKAGQLVSVYIHGNSSVTVMRGAKDVSGSYAVRRVMRVWSSTLTAGPPESRTAYTIDNTSFRVDSQEKPVGEWTDAPGFAFAKRQTRNERVLFEWVVWAETSYRETATEINGVYFILIVDLTASQYRLAMSKAIDLTRDQTLAANRYSGDPTFLPDATPWKTESDIAANGWADRQTAWQDYGTYNNQLPLPQP